MNNRIIRIVADRIETSISTPELRQLIDPEIFSEYNFRREVSRIGNVDLLPAEVSAVRELLAEVFQN